MKFLMILICVVVEMLKPADDYRLFAWFKHLEAWLHARCSRMGLWQGPIGVIITIFPGLLAVWLLFAILGDSVLLEFLFALVVMLYSLGPLDLSNQIDTYQTALAIDDIPVAEQAARAIVGSQDEAEEPPTRRGVATRDPGAKQRSPVCCFVLVCCVGSAWCAVVSSGIGVAPLTTATRRRVYSVGARPCCHPRLDPGASLGAGLCAQRQPGPCHRRVAVPRYTRPAR